MLGEIFQIVFVGQNNQPHGTDFRFTQNTVVDWPYLKDFPQQPSRPYMPKSRMT